MSKPSNILAEATELHRQGEFDQAAKLYREALKQRPRNAAVHYNLGSALFSMSDHAGAALAYGRASALEPDNDRFRSHWASQLRMSGRGDEAIEVWRKEASRRPQAIEPRVHLAKAQLAMRRTNDALATFEDVLRLDPANVDVMAELGRLLHRLGRYDEAKALADRALSLRADHGDAGVLRARLQARAGETDAARQALEAIMLSATDPMTRGRASLELATILEKRGEHDRAFAVVEQGQAAMFSRLSPAERDLRPALMVDRLCRKHITAETVAKWKPPPPDDRRDPVFIVGFPRSGTTLLEQMLSAHSGLVVTDELPLIQRVKDALSDRLDMRQQYPESLHALGERQLSVLREVYFDAARKSIGDDALAKRIVDKSPLNTTDLCMVRRIFPDARVIVALRDPRDAVLSSFFQAFARATPHFYGFESTAELYAHTMALWTHYRTALGLKWLEVRYEDVVDDPEKEARAMIELIGEPWEDAVLHYHDRKHKRYVTTPSFEDVGKPVYKTSLKRWERYPWQFERVRSYLEPFVREFGYGSW